MILSIPEIRQVNSVPPVFFSLPHGCSSWLQQHCPVPTECTRDQMHFSWVPQPQWVQTILQVELLSIEIFWAIFLSDLIRSAWFFSSNSASNQTKQNLGTILQVPASLFLVLSHFTVLLVFCRFCNFFQEHFF